MRLIIGAKWSSTWTMRGWLIARLSGLAFECDTLWLSRPDSKARLAQVSPTGLIPVLDHDGFLVTDTLAIAEYLWELAPGSDIWPADRQARAAARMAAAEMHSSFAALRAALPMNLVKRWPVANGLPSNVKLVNRPGVPAEIARVQDAWRHTRARWGAGGPFLFGAAFNAADAMYAPMASRFRTYAVELAPDAQAYADAVLSHPLVTEWIEGAHAQAREVGWDAAVAFP
ncbi:glutathione S-transferase [Roseomonas sp. CCTCC AB2023176]|uniref:glutathione S-transferase n=1 Tax=Roseomonas sp. CCTCC AB2023176 TaxID=3342640 RepID=UPI0035D5C42D